MLSYASHCLNVWGHAKRDHGSDPVRWWLREEDWKRLRDEIYIGNVAPGGTKCRVFMALPIAIEFADQPSRLVLRDGTAVLIGASPDGAQVS